MSSCSGLTAGLNYCLVHGLSWCTGHGHICPAAAWGVRWTHQVDWSLRHPCWLSGCSEAGTAQTLCLLPTHSCSQVPLSPAVDRQDSAIISSSSEDTSFKTALVLRSLRTQKTLLPTSQSPSDRNSFSPDLPESIGMHTVEGMDPATPKPMHCRKWKGVLLITRSGEGLHRRPALGQPSLPPSGQLSLSQPSLTGPMVTPWSHSLPLARDPHCFRPPSWLCLQPTPHGLPPLGTVSTSCQP